MGFFSFLERPEDQPDTPGLVEKTLEPVSAGDFDAPIEGQEVNGGQEIEGNGEPVVGGEDISMNGNQPGGISDVENEMIKARTAEEEAEMNMLNT